MKFLKKHKTQIIKIFVFNIKWNSISHSIFFVINMNMGSIYYFAVRSGIRMLSRWINVQSH